MVVHTAWFVNGEVLKSHRREYLNNDGRRGDEFNRAGRGG